MRQSERDRVFTELKTILNELSAARHEYEAGLKRLDAIDRSISTALEQLDPWVTIEDVCEMQKISIETARRDLFYLPGFGAMDGPQGWRRETFRIWMLSFDDHRKEWVRMRGDRKLRYRARLGKDAA